MTASFWINQDDSNRLAVVFVIVAAGVLAYVWWVTRKQ